MHECTDGVSDDYPIVYYAGALGDPLERAADRVQLDGSQHRKLKLLYVTCYKPCPGARCRLPCSFCASTNCILCYCIPAQYETVKKI